jgi:hypothetical protein
MTAISPVNLNRRWPRSLEDEAALLCTLSSRATVEPYLGRHWWHSDCRHHSRHAGCVVHELEAVFTALGEHSTRLRRTGQAAPYGFHSPSG